MTDLVGLPMNKLPNFRPYPMLTSMNEETQTPSWPEIDWLNPETEVSVVEPDGWYSLLKSVFDYILATLLVLPIGLGVLAGWIATRVSSSGPGFYSQTRCGRDAVGFSIIKIRSMTYNCEATTGIQWATQNDCRITRVGAILRKLHIDEFPQLLNVLRGEMSLVGPRPERPEVIETKCLAERIPGYNLRMSVKPGITGLAQVQLPADSDLRSVRHKLVYDLYYIANRTLWLDLRIMAATLLKAVGMKPHWLRRICMLPTAEVVAKVFVGHVSPPPPLDSGSADAAGFQPI